uniref:Uncharacterized protein n=1 Tax=Glossina pallidipes TaxID=7398 RepID=A0A1B0A8H7_GLOPL
MQMFLLSAQTTLTYVTPYRASGIPQGCRRFIDCEIIPRHNNSVHIEMQISVSDYHHDRHDHHDRVFKLQVPPFLQGDESQAFFTGISQSDSEKPMGQMQEILRRSLR